MKFVVILAIATVVAAQFAYSKADQTDSSSNDQNNLPAMLPIEMRGPSPPEQSPGQGQGQDQVQGQREGDSSEENSKSSNSDSDDSDSSE